MRKRRGVQTPASMLPNDPFIIPWAWLLPVLFIAGGVLLGWLCEWLLMSRLRAWAATTEWKGDDLILDGLKGILFVWISLAGLYGAVHVGHLEGRTEELAKNALKVGWILSLTCAVSRITGSALLLAVQRMGGALAGATILINLARAAIIVVGLLIALDSLGISITPILTALGVGGLAVALALQEPLANLFAGLQIIAAKRVRPGDYVKLDNGDEGRVTDIAWRNTVITTLTNNTVVVPNAKLASAVLTNYHLPDAQLFFSTPVSIAYGSDLDRVERIALEVATEVMTQIPGGVPEAEVTARFIAFAESAITCQVVLRAQEYPDQFLLRHELIKRLHRRFRAEGIEIPYPTRSVILHRDGQSAES